jgi:hypothetical protein
MKYVVAMLLLCLSLQAATAQDVYTSSGKSVDHPYQRKKGNNGFDPSRIIVGAGFVAMFGSQYTDLGASPILGYRFTERFSAGVGFGFEYVKSQIQLYDQNSGAYANYPEKSTNYYPSVWAREMVYRNFFVEGIGEYVITNYNTYDYDVNYNVAQEKINVGVACLLLGGGLRLPVGGRVAMVPEVLYDVLQNQYSPYYHMIDFRIGACVGL